MTSNRRQLGYVLGPAVATLVALGMAMLDLREDGIVISVFVAPVVLAALVGGIWPGLITTVLGAAYGALLCHPQASLAVASASDVVRLVMVGLLGVTLSVTFEILQRNQRRRDHELAERVRSERRIKQLIFSAPIATSLSRMADGRVLEVNDAYLQLFAVTPGDIVGRRPEDAGITGDEVSRTALLAQIRATGSVRDLEVTARSTTGQVWHVLTSSQLVELDGETLVLSAFVDVTARRQAEAHARAADQRLREIIEHVDAAFWIVDGATFRTLYTSPQCMGLFGRKHADVEEFLACVHPDDVPMLQARIAGGNVPADAAEFRIRTPDGAERWVKSRLFPVHDEAGKLVRIVGNAEDITARKQAEAAARVSDGQLQQLAENIQQVFWLTDARTGRTLYVSPAFDRVWGRSATQLREDARAWANAIHPEDRARILAQLPTQVQGNYDERYRIIRPDGSVRWIRDKAWPVRDAEGQVCRIAGIAEDITDQLLLEDKLHQAQRLESIGLLAGGVAHDFNNILTVLTTSTDLIADGMPEAHPDREIVSDMKAALERATGLTKQLLAFGRKQVFQPRVCDVNKVVEEARRLLRRMLRERVALRVSLDPDLVAAFVDPNQLVQVLVNLCVNARDAITDEGVITIATRAAPGKLQLVVSDTGCGMTEEVRARVFEPFFTTKELGRGTGLGLSVVHGIVEQAGGTIEITTEVGRGTTFRIELPATAEPVRATIAPPVGDASREGVERILLVDDDDYVRAAASRALNKRGYTVLEASDGRDALRVLDETSEPFDLLVTDVVMPNMDGRQLAERLAVQYPKLHVLFTSGYTDDEIVRRGIRQAQVAFLEKPFAPRALAAKVRDVLDGR